MTNTNADRDPIDKSVISGTTQTGRDHYNRLAQSPNNTVQTEVDGRFDELAGDGKTDFGLEEFFNAASESGNEMERLIAGLLIKVGKLESQLATANKELEKRSLDQAIVTSFCRFLKSQIDKLLRLGREASSDNKQLTVAVLEPNALYIIGVVNQWIDLIAHSETYETLRLLFAQLETNLEGLIVFLNQDYQSSGNVSSLQERVDQIKEDYDAIIEEPLYRDLLSII